MKVLPQIALGSGLLVVCGLLHIAVAARLLASLKARRALRRLERPSNMFGLTSLVFAVFVLSHTLHVYLWAFLVWAVGALQGYEAPIYFALVTYTTLGYGDVTLSPDFRILGAMASVTGILMFGLTTAFLVGVFARGLGADRP